MRPRLLDLFCGAGGAAMGYHRAGFDVIGVDINPQPNYPFEFVQGDALDPVNWGRAAAIHASPPCQRYSTITARHGRQDEHPDLIPRTRFLLEATGVPYVIENVEGAPLHHPVRLCGSMFGLQVRRHRLFEANVSLTQLECDHRSQGPVVGVYGNTGGSSKRDGVTFGKVEDWKRAMDIDWMKAVELAQSIPPAYTDFIGRQLFEAIA